MSKSLPVMGAASGFSATRAKTAWGGVSSTDPLMGGSRRSAIRLSITNRFANARALVLPDACVAACRHPMGEVAAAA